MIRAPSRGTSDRLNNRSRERSVCFHGALFRTLRRPRGTNRPDYAHAGEDMATSHAQVGWCAPGLPVGLLRPWELESLGTLARERKSGSSCVISLLHGTSRSAP